MKKNISNYLSVGTGLLLAACGLILMKAGSNPQGIMRALPYVMVGVGCGLFGGGMGDLLGKRAVKNSPEVAKRIEIEANDERNVAISNKSKAKAYDIMTFVLGALMVAFALMGTDITAVLLLVFAYLFIQGCGVYFRIKYDKEM